MNAKELACKAEVKRVDEKRTSQKDRAARLGISERQFRRILQRYRREGVYNLVSKKRGVPSNRKMEESIRVIVEGFIHDPRQKILDQHLWLKKLNG